jgi:hypothetical protein
VLVKNSQKILEIFKIFLSTSSDAGIRYVKKDLRGAGLSPAARLRFVPVPVFVRRSGFEKLTNSARLFLKS